MDVLVVPVYFGFRRGGGSSELVMDEAILSPAADAGVSGLGATCMRAGDLLVVR